MAFQLRAYAAASGLNRSQIQDRVVEVLKTFEKVSPEKVSFHPNSLASKQEREAQLGRESQVTADASFTKDLGLDSLDAVEVVMAIEEEFAVEMSDEDAESVWTRACIPLNHANSAITAKSQRLEKPSATLKRPLKVCCSPWPPSKITST